MSIKEQIENTIRINGQDILLGDAIEIWEEAGICRDCINYRLEMNETYQDHYENFAFLHCKDCLC